jgi:N-acyl-D-aspartate/D-glutamate deacylase
MAMTVKQVESHLQAIEAARDTPSSAHSLEDALRVWVLESIAKADEGFEDIDPETADIETLEELARKALEAAALARAVLKSKDIEFTRGYGPGR